MARPGRVDTDASFRVSLGEVAGTAGVVEMDVGDGHRCHIVDPEMVERCIEVGDGNGGPALDQHPFGRVEEVAGEPLRLAVHTCIDEVQVMSQVGNAYIHQAKTLPVAVSVRAPTLSNARAPRKDCIVDLNLVVLAGRLAAPPEIRQFESGSTARSLPHHRSIGGAFAGRRRPGHALGSAASPRRCRPGARSADVGCGVRTETLLGGLGRKAEPAGSSGIPGVPSRSRRRRAPGGVVGTLITMSRVTIAASSHLAAEAGAAMADSGGNAVDAAVTATITAMTTEPGIIAPGGSCFVVIWPPDDDPIVIDANAAVPGKGLDGRAAGFGDLVWMEYGGGMHTRVGAASVAVPGAFAGLFEAVSRAGLAGWRDVMKPATRLGGPRLLAAGRVGRLPRLLAGADLRPRPSRVGCTSPCRREHSRGRRDGPHRRAGGIVVSNRRSGPQRLLPPAPSEPPSYERWMMTAAG